MRLIVVTGLSGSGKSVAIRLLEDLGFYCVDNLPSLLLRQVCEQLGASGHADIAVSIDARSEASMAGVGAELDRLRAAGHDVRVLFLTASDDALVQRFSETRRRHPLQSRALADASGRSCTLEEAIALERELLAPLHEQGHAIDTSGLPANTLRQWVRAFVDGDRAPLTLAFESFAFKSGLPDAADLVFDVRNLPNPYYERELRALTGLDEPVAAFLRGTPRVGQMIDDIAAFLERWLPSYVDDGRQYLTVAIGCTGGQHRSAYVVEQLSARFRDRARVLVRHRILHR